MNAPFANTFARIPVPTDSAFHFQDSVTGKFYVRAKDCNTGDVNTEHVDFGLSDSRGRKIGARIRTYRQDRVPAIGSNTLLAPDSLGTGWFVLDVHATRDGKPYGASQATRYFESATARSIATDRYLADARKRAAR